MPIDDRFIWEGEDRWEKVSRFMIFYGQVKKEKPVRAYCRYEKKHF